MMRNVNTKIGYVLLIAVMMLSAAGITDPGLCGCEHEPEDLEMPTISDTDCCTSCCDRAEQDDDCCCTLKDQGAESRADGFLPRSNPDDDSAPVTQSSPGSMTRIATGKNRCIERASTIDRFPPHLCTTVLLI